MTFLWLIFVTSMFISFSCNYDGIFIRRWLFASMIFMTCTNLHCKSTQILSYKHQNHQKIIQYSDNLTIIHIIPHYFGCKTKKRYKVSTILPHSPIWFVIYPLWFVDTSFCISNTQQLLKIASISTLFPQNPCTIKINVVSLQHQNPQAS